MGVSISDPKASTTVAGRVELATLAEAATGTDTARAVTPEALGAIPSVAAGTYVTATTTGTAPTEVTTIGLTTAFTDVALSGPQLAATQGNGTTVSNTTTETALTTTPTFTVAANRLTTGSIIRIITWGMRLDNVASSSTSTVRTRVGGVAGTSLGNFVIPAKGAASATVMNWVWETNILIVSAATPSAATWEYSGRFSQNDPTSSTSDWQRTHRSVSGTALDLTASADWVTTVVHGTANTGLTMQQGGFVAYITDPL